MGIVDSSCVFVGRSSRIFLEGTKNFHLLVCYFCHIAACASDMLGWEDGVDEDSGVDGCGGS